MEFRVYLLRRRGRRLPWREVKRGPSYVGDLTTYAVNHHGEGYELAALRLPGCPKGKDLIPDLYEPVLTCCSTLAFRLRGFERVGQGDNAYSVVQEWHCELP